MSGSAFIPVREVMARDPEQIDGMATVKDALAVMSAKGISSLVVRRRDERDEYGIVLIADIAREIVSRNRSVARTNVYEVMTKPAPAVDADMDIKYAVRHMTRLGLSHCIVLQGRALAGIVTLRDMTIRCIASTEAGGS